MEQFINQAKAFLGILESVLPKGERDKAIEAADEMYQKMRETVENHKLSIRQMVYACVAILTAVLEIADSETKKIKEQEEAK